MPGHKNFATWASAVKAAMLKLYNKIQRIKTKAVNKYRVYSGNPEVDKATADLSDISQKLKALIKKRVGTTVRTG
tara:strand:+ start:600 stop:824 length:225 start_codon:yes stop_codon:yes gene_type:complete